MWLRRTGRGICAYREGPFPIAQISVCVYVCVLWQLDRSAANPERATVLLCVAVRCACSGLDAAHTRPSPRRGLPPKSAPCKISSKHKQQSSFRAATARAGYDTRAAGWPRGRPGVELIHRGVLLQVDHQQRHRVEPAQRPTSAARSECAALAPTPAGPENSVNGQVFDANNNN